jgi:hypothetical protein
VFRSGCLNVKKLVTCSSIEVKGITDQVPFFFPFSLTHFASRLKSMYITKCSHVSCLYTSMDCSRCRGRVMAIIALLRAGFETVNYTSPRGVRFSLSSSSSLARQPCVGPGLLQEFPPVFSIHRRRMIVRPAFASSDFLTLFFQGGVAAPRPTPRDSGGPMFSVGVFSLSWLVPI